MAAVNLIGSYNYALVALSVLIAMFASYAALDLAGRLTAAGRWTRCCGYWAGPVRWGRAFVHALHWDAGVHPADSRGLPLADRSAVTVAAVLASVIALYMVSRQKWAPPERLLEVS